MKKPFHLKLLLREIERKKEKNARYSLRGFAKYLGIAPSTLSRILTNGQELSVGATKKIMKKLQLTEHEKFLFIASIAEEKKARTLQTLGKFQDENTKADFKFTLESIANIAMKHLSDGCIIHLSNGQDDAILHAKHKQNHFSLSNFHVMNTPLICHPLLSPDFPVFINIKGKYDDVLEQLNAESLMCVPVIKDNQKYGAITFLRIKGRENFCEKDLERGEELSKKAAYVYELLTEI